LVAHDSVSTPILNVAHDTVVLDDTCVQSAPPNKVPKWIGNVESSKVKSKNVASCPT